jgi:methyl-accepting chemotaxis protein
MKSIKGLIIGCITIAIVLVGSISLGIAYYYNKVEFSNGLVQKARTIHLRLSEIAKFVATQGGLGRTIEFYKEKYKNPEDLTDQDKQEILNQVPIYAAIVVGNANAGQDQYSFRIFSRDPRNKENKATDAELLILDRFQTDQSLPEIVEETSEKITVFKPVRISKSQGCLTCHGDPATSPWGNGKDILGYKMENWDDGRLHAVFAVVQNKNEAIKAQAAAGKTDSTGVMAIAIFVCSFIILFLSIMLVTPRVARLQVIFNNLREQLVLLIKSQRSLDEVSSSLSSSSTEQAAATEEVASALEEVRSMVERNSEGANTANKNASECADKASQLSDLSQDMSGKIEDLGKTITEVNEQLKTGVQKMGDIESMMSHISNQTKIVNDIAFQTKILSFNASVEAARAGDQGKGFAVVAQQVGELAALSSKAAKEISELLKESSQKVSEAMAEWVQQAQEIEQMSTVRISEGLEVTQMTVAEIQNLSDLVNSISGNIMQIAEASKEQSQGVFEINKAIGEISTSTQANATSANNVEQATKLIGDSCDNITNLGDDLKEVIEGR